MNAKAKTEIHPLGDSALIVEWKNVSASDALPLVHAAASKISASKLDGFIEAVPGFTSVAVYYEPLRADWPTMNASIRKCLAKLTLPKSISGKRVEIPVCYDPEFALDQDRLCEHLGLPFEKIIQLHSSVDYKVQLIGFAPGFCYLAGLPEPLTMPRLSFPRVCVPAGSVGIGHNQTGVYPFEIPGGWNLIGRTPAKLFRPELSPPTLLSPGDTVRFTPISRDEFTSLRDRR